MTKAEIEQIQKLESLIEKLTERTSNAERKLNALYDKKASEDSGIVRGDIVCTTSRNSLGRKFVIDRVSGNGGSYSRFWGMSLRKDGTLGKRHEVWQKFEKVGHMELKDAGPADD